MQRTTANHSSVVEVAVLGIVDRIAENRVFVGEAIDQMIDFGHVGCGDHEKDTVEIGRIERFLSPGDLSSTGEFVDVGVHFRGNDVNLGFREQQAFDLRLGDIASADHEDSATAELQKYGKQ